MAQSQTTGPDVGPSTSPVSCCPFCFELATVAFEKPPFTIFDCRQCSHRFCNPPTSEDHVADVFGDDYFKGGSGGYYDYLGRKALLVRKGVKYAGILERFRKTPQRRILDVGCATGFLLKGLQDGGWEGFGIDPNRSMIAHGAGELGLDLRHQSVEEFANCEKSNRLDATIMVQVLPHIANPVSAINAVHSLLEDQGLLLIEAWNWQSLTARLFNQSWHEYNPPSVLHWFSKTGLAKLLGDNGFEVIAKGRPTKWVSVGNGASLIRHSLRESTLGRIATLPLGVLPKRLELPYFLDDVFWMLAQKR